MNIDDFNLGAYKKESEFTKGKFIRQKCYIEVAPDGKINSTDRKSTRLNSSHVT